MTTDVTVTAPDDTRRRVALLKAVGLDRLAPEQRELALNLSERYGLDLLLKHLVLIEGRAYVTRDGLLHIAHRSGVFDGMEVTLPVLDGDYWRATCSVYRKDMSRPFTYSGRYPSKGGNQKFAPEMAVKVAEVQALRRAFDVSAPTAEERWDLEAPEPEPVAKPTLAEVAAAKRPKVVVEPAPHAPLHAFTPEDEILEAIADEIEDAELVIPLDRGEFNALASASHVTKADVVAGRERLGIPDGDVSPDDYGRLADHLGLR